MSHDVFISYSSKDKTVADAACAVLEQHGIRCWMAPRDIRPGADWGEAIIDGIQGARAFVLVFSGHANESQQIKREVERAVHRGLPVIPLRIENVVPAKSLEYFLSTPHWLDAFTPPLEQHLSYLADVLHAILAGTSAPAPPPPKPPPQPNRRLMIGAALIAIALLALIGWFVLAPAKPPTFTGSWTAQKIALSRAGDTGGFTYLTDAFADNGRQTTHVSAKLEIDDLGQYQFTIDSSDQGTVSVGKSARYGDALLTFTSDYSHRSLSANTYIMKDKSAGGFAYGGAVGDSILLTNPPAPLAQTGFYGRPRSGTGPLSGFTGVWRNRSFGMPGSPPSNSSLEITADGKYRFRQQALQKGIWQAANGSFTLKLPMALPVAGTYRFDGSDQMSWAWPGGSIVWARD